MNLSSLMKHIFVLLVATVFLAGCDFFSSEPVYGGLSAEGMNYTPYNLTEFVVRDKYGNRASGGGDLPPGSGEGSLSCCYKLKGTEFTVEWEVYDMEEFSKDIYAPIKKIKKVTTVHLDPVKRSDRAGNDVLAVHFYPDDHVEFEFRNDFSGSRFDYGEVDEWFQTKYGKAANPDDLDWAAAYRRTTRVAVQGWLKYRFTDSVDLEQYVYYTLLVNPKFDEHPAVQRIVMESKGKPGAFGLAMQKLPVDVVREIKSNKFDHVANGSKVGQADSI
ncbi:MULTISPECIES: DUF3304 domain-containing protein [unclassified Caballeronia]|uniref:DUF3304 domain-containing protein n=1 Tax=unclassified Caballeronia TaxID=2646786 RepID=UPI002859EEED|nr:MULTISPECIES: DUF3304 domain-containing protein [unclassified Caballeronia]MDR5773548.1 DUF3304 domain-containing protein [Caballeronia sp. LZ002]MDR5848982.1 DUF3304 domain-containing protein [Caballeronia sp. LZ003]